MPGPTRRPVHPLAHPPPPLPARALDHRPPSVLVFPLPVHPSPPSQQRTHQNSLPYLLMRALGQAMTMRVGPVRIMGNVARIEVPNRKVEARALSMKFFTCLGQRVYMVRNDRLMDGPSAARRGETEGERALLLSLGCEERQPTVTHVREAAATAQTGLTFSHAAFHAHGGVSAPTPPPSSRWFRRHVDDTGAEEGDVRRGGGEAMKEKEKVGVGAAAVPSQMLQIGVFSDSDDEDEGEDKHEENTMVTAT